MDPETQVALSPWAVALQMPAMTGEAAPAPVHLRAGGERPKGDLIDYIAIGSSPRGRGTLGRQDAVGHRTRFIPAWAGNAENAS